MCGIFAILFDRKNKLYKISEKTLHSLKKRGPDSYTEYQTESTFFAFSRLAIMDPSEKGNQPMRNGNITLLCNGEIYNYKDLKAEYKLNCESESDCEVILKLYEKIGFVEMVKKLYGVFAIILVDDDTMYLARDRIGVRPMYYAYSRKKFMVSSVPNCLATELLGNILPFPPGLTAVRHRYDKHESFQYLYSDTVMLSPNRISNGQQCLRNALENAIKVRLMSDRPMGCLLSGGLDSSLVVAILVKFLGAKNVRTYSIGMLGSTDLFFARKVADFFGTQHHEILFTPEEGIAVIPEVIQILGSYDITTIRASVGMYLLAKYISQNTTDKVIFSGEGSDEILEGYLYFHNAPTPALGEEESLRLVQNLYLYDVLRADRCISSWGLEPRVPFLDRTVVDVAFSLPAEEKYCGDRISTVDSYRIEKSILREAFKGYLPNEILYRKKEAFSDGVSSKQKSWYTYIQEKAEMCVADKENFPSKEAKYYKEIFDSIFPGYKPNIPYWMPKWSGDINDPSARVLTIY